MNLLKLLTCISTLNWDIRKRSSFLLVCLLFSASSFARPPISANRFEVLTGKEKIHKIHRSQDNTVVNEVGFAKKPAHFLVENYKYILPGSTILDVRMNTGQNTIFLAQKGFRVTGLNPEISSIKKTRMLAREFNVQINTIATSIDEYFTDPDSFDAIICFYPKTKQDLEKILPWLKAEGILIVETFSTRQLGVNTFNNRTDNIFLPPGKLLQMFNKKFRVIKYEEPIPTENNVESAFTASIVLQKI